jgi:hypothetical protein
VSLWTFGPVVSVQFLVDIRINVRC